MNSYTVVDADGHIMEPPDLFESNLEPRYRDRAYRLVKDEKGLDHPFMDGKMLDHTRPPGTLAVYGAVDQPIERYLAGEINYADALLPGAYIPDERIKVMDQEGIDRALLYPSLGLEWETSSTDPYLVAAHCRVYTDWLVQFCQHDTERLLPVAHISLMDVEEAARETRRVAEMGVKGLMVLAYPPTNGVPFGETLYDPFWSAAQEVGLPVSIHVHGGGDHFPAESFVRRPWEASWWWWFVVAGEFVVYTITSLFQGATFDRFPNQKIVALEAGCGWLQFWLERMDEYFKRYGFETPMKLTPSEYFHRQCWISMEPSEKIGLTMIDLVGADRFIWASDYPHSDAEMDVVTELKKTLGSLPDPDLRKVMGDNAIKIYNLN